MRWKTPIPGQGHSSPVVWGGRVFTTCGDERTGTRTVVCLNADDGSVRLLRVVTPAGETLRIKAAAAKPGNADFQSGFTECRVVHLLPTGSKRLNR